MNEQVTAIPSDLTFLTNETAGGADIVFYVGDS
jgi:hypothetical protein